MLRPPPSQTAASLFVNYDLDACFDEMFAPGHKPRDAYRLLFDRLLELPAAEWQRRQQAADRAFLNQGVTFTVYGNDEGTERISPTTSCRASSPGPSGASSSGGWRSAC